MTRQTEREMKACCACLVSLLDTTQSRLSGVSYSWLIEKSQQLVLGLVGYNSYTVRPQQVLTNERRENRSFCSYSNQNVDYEVFFFLNPA